MKAFVVCAALLAAAAQAELSPSAMEVAIRSKWSAYKAEHGKEYHPSEEDHRLTTYLENSRAIDEHNIRFHQGLESFEMGHNDMSDLTLEEIISSRMGHMEPENGDELFNNATTVAFAAPSGVAAPASVDWRTSGCVQKVKNQGTCGSCYCFAAIGAVETAHCLKHNRQLLDMSEQHIVDCAGRGCNGGFTWEVFGYIRDNGGTMMTNQYPYTGRGGSCRASSSRVARVQSFVRLPVNDEEALKQAVATVGTLAISYNAGTRAHAYYRSGILDVPDCGQRTSHAVLLVGYGSEGGKDYWLLKNSWGPAWGENGYLRLVRGKNQCGITTRACYPIVY